MACVAQTVGDSRRSVVYNLSLPGGHPKTWNSVLSSTTAELNDLLSRLENQNEKLVSAYKGILSHRECPIKLYSLHQLGSLYLKLHAYIKYIHTDDDMSLTYYLYNKTCREDN